VSKLSFGKAKPVEPKEADTGNAPESVETEVERQARCNRENAEAAAEAMEKAE
jgi:hypothetical protein